MNNEDQDRFGYTYSDIEGFRRENARKRYRLKHLLELAREQVDNDVSED